MRIKEQKMVKIGDKYKYVSSNPEIQNFEFTVFGINGDYLDIIVNNCMYQKIHKRELLKAKKAKKVEK